MKKVIISSAFLYIILVLITSCHNKPKNDFEQLKPNILWITIEDTSPQFIGCYGNKNAKTPVIDRLANEGVRFTNAFSTGTVCSPSRTAIITGVKTYQTGTGHHRSKYPVPGFIKGFSYYLQQQGYYTTNNSKTDYNVANEKKFISEAWNESSNKAGWWNRKPGQSFFAVFNYNDSHQSRTMTETYDWYIKNVLDHLTPDERTGDNDFEMPPIYRDSPEMRKQFARAYNSLKLTDKKIDELLKRLENDNLKDSTIIFFFSDHGEGMPRGKTNGIDYGHRIAFTIWFPEMYKHLSPWGTSGIVTDELIDFTDLAPTLISLAGGNIPEHLNGRAFLGKKRTKPQKYLYLSNDRSDNGIDMTRTVTDGKYIYSRNFLPFINEVRYIRYMEIGEIKQQMRKDLAENKLNKLQKSLFEPRPPEFLFDIENDLWETRNLVDEKEFQPVLTKMKELLKQEIISSRDVMLLPEYELGIISKFTTPYEFRFDNTNYPVDKIYDAASLSGFRGSDIAAEQIKLLTDENPVVRYWAVMGLRSQEPETIKPFYNQIIKATNDDYLPAAVIASNIAYHVFGDETAKQNIIKFCENENPDISLLSVYLLLYIEPELRKPFVETIENLHKTGNRNYNIKAACMDFLGSMELVPNNPDYRE